uniref:Uncharacterized protein K02A2.6-like n=1 Tax=Saccoglossus kowalevskii TaxID=10224 RepID=A0ABM0MBB2_SACKO
MLMGTECKKILKRLQLTDDEMKEPQTILDKLEAHFVPKRNVLYERYVFHNAEQQPNETIDQLVIRLRQLAEPCKFGTFEDEMVRDRLVLGCKDSIARARLFREQASDLHKVIESLRISEVSRQQLSQMGNDVTVNPVNYVKKGGKHTESNRHKYTEQRKERPKYKQTKDKSSQCRYCGSNHERDKNKCPAYGKTCRNCGKQNHFQSVCKQKRQVQQNLHQLQDEVSDSDDSIFKIDTIGAVQYGHRKKFYIPITFRDTTGETRINCQLDTGATCNVMTYNDLCDIKQHGKPALEKTTARLKLYDDSIVNAIGECNLICKVKDKEYTLNFKVIAGKQKPLLSGDTCTNMGLITLNVVNSISQEATPTCTSKDNVIKQYNDVFEGLGCLPGEYKIEIDSTIKPVQHVPRRVPIPLKAKLKAKINEMERKGIIKKVTKSTDWISSIVVVLKPNKLRVCLDPRDLNRAIKRPKYQMPTLDEILPKLSDAKVFSILDAKDGFHQVKLDEQSSYLTTFWTPFGRYRYVRMPFGISSASEEFQRRLHDALDDIP